MGSAATVRDAGLVFVADDLAAWLVGILADAARKRLAIAEPVAYKQAQQEKHSAVVPARLTSAA